MYNDECITFLQDANKKTVGCPSNKFIRSITERNNRWEVTCCSPTSEHNQQTSNQSLKSRIWNGDNSSTVIIGGLIVMLVALIFLGKNLVTIVLVIAFLIYTKVDVVGMFKKLLDANSSS